ncbi:hypothetical protein XBKB1_1190003 [Xenorhabdus bovienii str. kraussei Becker Underwood]|uniref:Uncharacterized protein n=1 Tax=Xenorhabdus bovienii str. kraussei Becker Underwood TaxID=1398204 RepID=A0A077PN00_XENBV|nr:hypothetical protein XBKB1_1190003 [Xenorhabdus bovienii str. kraussei Becker Underwood]
MYTKLIRQGVNRNPKGDPHDLLLDDTPTNTLVKGVVNTKWAQHLSPMTKRTNVPGA